ncbi:MAG: hypothetical protein ACXVBO_14430, partial [Isosphaeraceae bacterium]
HLELHRLGVERAAAEAAVASSPVLLGLPEDGLNRFETGLQSRFETSGFSQIANRKNQARLRQSIYLMTRRTSLDRDNAVLVGLQTRALPISLSRRRSRVRVPSLP